jgi:hypothetical protein
LFRVGHFRLKSDHIPQHSGAVVLSELNNRIRALTGALVEESDRFHWPESERVFAASRHLFNRQASLEVDRSLKFFLRNFLRG